MLIRRSASVADESYFNQEQSFSSFKFHRLKYSSLQLNGYKSLAQSLCDSINLKPIPLSVRWTFFDIGTQ